MNALAGHSGMLQVYLEHGRSQMPALLEALEQAGVQVDPSYLPAPLDVKGQTYVCVAFVPTGSLEQIPARWRPQFFGRAPCQSAG